MSGLSAKQLRRAFDFIDKLRGVDGLDAFASDVVRALPQLIDCDLIGYNEIAPQHGRLHAVVSQDYSNHGEIEAAWTRHQAEHPTFQHVLRTGDGSAWRISDFLTRREYRQTGIYHECYRLIGGEAHMSLSLESPPGVIVALAFNRSSGDFTQGERDLLNLVRPHLSHAYNRALTTADLARRADRATAALEALDDGVLAIIEGQTSLAWSTGRARQFLAHYFGVTGDALPPRIVAWLAAPGTAAGPLVIAAAQGRLVVNAMPGGSAGERLLLLSERRVLPTTSDGLAHVLKLTAREADVLLGLMHGNTNPDIARALDCRPRTIEKHVENLFRKLDVTTRTAAVARAMQALSDVR